VFACVLSGSVRSENSATGPVNAVFVADDGAQLKTFLGRGAKRWRAIRNKIANPYMIEIIV
jgi:hypothetical protein